jgi:hypothetical protein
VSTRWRRIGASISGSRHDDLRQARAPASARFADSRVESSQAQTRAWERQKTAERRGGLLGEIPRAAMRRAEKSPGARRPLASTGRTRGGASADEEIAELDVELSRARADAQPRTRLGRVGRRAVRARESGGTRRSTRRAHCRARTHASCVDSSTSSGASGDGRASRAPLQEMDRLWDGLNGWKPETPAVQSERCDREQHPGCAAASRHHRARRGRMKRGRGQP